MYDFHLGVTTFTVLCRAQPYHSKALDAGVTQGLLLTAGARWLLFHLPTRAGHLSVPCGTGPRRCALAPVFHMLSNMKRQGTMVSAALSYMWRSTS